MAMEKTFMTPLEIILIALALAMDAFAVSVAVGTTGFLKSKRARFRISFHFGLFQFLMPILGWMAGSTISSYIENMDHWLALALLGYVGGKMIKESFDRGPQKYRLNPSRGWSLILLSVATSIDALAVGLSLAFIGATIWSTAAIIGLITAALSLIGILLGKSVGGLISKRAELVGGLVLIFIGVKIVIEHLAA